MSLRRVAVVLFATGSLLAVPGAGVATAATCPPGAPAHDNTMIIDAARALPMGTEPTLERTLRPHGQAVGAEIVVAIVNNTGGYAVDRYARELFNCWGVGDARKDNGVLMLFALGAHTVRIEIGSGLGSRLTDAEASDVLREMVVPQLRSNNVIGGVAAGVAGIVMALSSSPTQDVPVDAFPESMLPGGLDPVDPVDVPSGPAAEPISTPFDDGGISPFAPFLVLAVIGVFVGVGRLFAKSNGGGGGTPDGWVLSNGRQVNAPDAHPDWTGRNWRWPDWADAARQTPPHAASGPVAGYDPGSPSPSSPSSSSGSSASDSSGSSFGGGSSSGGGASGSW